MKLQQIHKQFSTKQNCIEYLEKLRWNNKPICPYCRSNKSRPNAGEIGRHTCKKCFRSFTVLIDSIFESSRLPLPTWFLIIGLTLNAKNGISAKEIMRHTGTRYKTAYYIGMRIRIGMLLPNTQLSGVIEMDESYFGGTTRNDRRVKDNVASLATTSKLRGRGTNKVSVVGMIQRKGHVKTKLIERLTKRNLMGMLRQYARALGSVLITDNFRSYAKMNELITHLSIKHKEGHSRGGIHINTIEGYWSYVKNGIRGNYRAISKKYLPFYLVEYEWKYNHRKNKNQFDVFMKNALQHEKELEYWKADSTQQVKEIAYTK